MTIYVLAEGPSERAFLDQWLPRLGLSHEIKVHPHQGKGSIPRDITAIPERHRRGLLDQLPAKLRAFASTLDSRINGIVVLVDADSDDPFELRQQILAIANACCPGFNIAICIAQEETEAFYLGDLSALQNGYPGCDMDLARSYVPDSICGTWELFGQVISDDGGNKVAWGAKMGRYTATIPGRSRSISFNYLLNGLRVLDSLPTVAPKPAKKHRHSARDRSR